MPALNRSFLYCEGCPKPLMRGVLHALSAPIVPTVGCGLLIYMSERTMYDITAAVAFSGAIMICFCCSAAYHRTTWRSKRDEIIAMKLDYCGISIAIAGSYIHLCMYTLERTDGMLLFSLSTLVSMLSFVWIFRGNPPTIMHLSTACTAIPFLPSMYINMGPRLFCCALSVWILHAIGLLIYKTKRPDPWPTVFGHHEVFHTLVVAATVLTYYVHSVLVSRI